MNGYLSEEEKAFLLRETLCYIFKRGEEEPLAWWVDGRALFRWLYPYSDKFHRWLDRQIRRLDLREPEQLKFSRGRGRRLECLVERSGALRMLLHSKSPALACLSAEAMDEYRDALRVCEINRSQAKVDLTDLLDLSAANTLEAVADEIDTELETSKAFNEELRDAVDALVLSNVEPAASSTVTPCISGCFGSGEYVFERPVRISLGKITTPEYTLTAAQLESLQRCDPAKICQEAWVEEMNREAGGQAARDTADAVDKEFLAAADVLAPPAPAGLRTIEAWLLELPDGYRELALHYHRLHGSANSLRSRALDTALANAFPYSRTAEGYDFWCRVARWACCGDPLPPLPVQARLKGLEPESVGDAWQPAEADTGTPVVTAPALSEVQACAEGRRQWEALLEAARLEGIPEILPASTEAYKFGRPCVFRDGLWLPEDAETARCGVLLISDCPDGERWVQSVASPGQVMRQAADGSVYLNERKLEVLEGAVRLAKTPEEAAETECAASGGICDKDEENEKMAEFDSNGNWELLPPHEFGGVLITQRAKDGYVNATAMCKANGKLYGNYGQTQMAKDYLKALESAIGIPIALLAVPKATGPYEERGTWIHPRAAIDLARWCSPKFAVWVDGWIYDYLERRPAAPQRELTRRELAVMLLESEDAKDAALSARDVAVREQAGLAVKAVGLLEEAREKDAVILAKDAEIRELAPQARAYANMQVDIRGHYTVSEVAKHLQRMFPEPKVSQPVLYSLMRYEFNLLFIHKNEAKQWAIDPPLRLMYNDRVPVKRSHGTDWVPTPMFTEAGVAWVEKKYAKWLAKDPDDAITAGMTVSEIVKFRVEQILLRLASGKAWKKAAEKFFLLLSRNPETLEHSGVQAVQAGVESGHIDDNLSLVAALKAIS